MAEIMSTTLVPSKLELLARWMRATPWFRGAITPELVIVGGFRLDDPEGEVGLEFFVLRDDADGEIYHVPVSYRGAPLPGSNGHEDAAFLGTMEHGILGTRYVYDGPADPVWRSTVAALLDGEASPQHRTESNTPDRTVRLVAGTEAGAISESTVVRHPAIGDPEGPGVVAPWDAADGTEVSGLLLRGA
ncbi:MAG: hypothetical protein LBE25_05685 [Arthrobacter sp.]|jgi:hypothetical protein|nr:hypothetical protein [Arthrobacter sp.]